MWLVLIPVVLLFVIILVPLPKIGGNVRIGLLMAGLSAALISSLSPLHIIEAMIFGINKLSWVIMLSLFGSIYAETQVRLGAVETVLDLFKKIFGQSVYGLTCAIILTLVLSGSLLGDAISAATVIGLLVIRSLDRLCIPAERITAIIIMGAIIGSGMPPISQSFIMAASFTNILPRSVMTWAYITMSVSVVLAMLVGCILVKRHQNRAIDDDLPPFCQLIIGRWKTLIPLVCLCFIIAIKMLGISVFEHLPLIEQGADKLKQVPVLGGITFPVVSAIIVATFVSFGFKSLRKDVMGIVSTGIKKVSITLQIQLCAGIMVGLFYKSGLIASIQNYTEHLSAKVMSLGGGIATLLTGMLTGSQTTAQTMIISIVAPALKHAGLNPVHVAAGAANLAMAGQSMPPIGLTAFVVAGLVGGMLGIKVNPVKAMLLILPITIYFMIIGFLMWFTG